MRLSLVLVLGLLPSAWSRTRVRNTCKDLGKGVIDQGCNETAPVCVYNNGGQVVGGNAGQRCALCINSLQPNDVDQVAPDEGCNDVNRVCVGSRQLAANAAGTACAVCFNSIPTSIDPNDIDDGCPPTAPVCVGDDGASPALWAPGTDCVANCVDTSLSGADKGVSDCAFFALCSDKCGSSLTVLVDCCLHSKVLPSLPDLHPRGRNGSRFRQSWYSLCDMLSIDM